jgi:hypothetical protein
VLDVMLFGRLKSTKKYLPRNPELDPQLDHAIRACRAYEIATTSMTIRDHGQKSALGSSGGMALTIYGSMKKRSG